MTGDVRIPLIKPLKRALRRGHPWVFRDAIKRVTVRPGTVVTLVDENDKFVARGWADEGPIAVRVLTTRDEPVDAELLRRRIDDADRVRRQVVPPETNTLRLIHGEGDRLPGVVCDLYGSHATLALDGSASVANKDLLVELLVPVLQARGVEGLLVRSGRRGRRSVEMAWGRNPPDIVEVKEQGLVLACDLIEGQKTGLFLDHRTARRMVRRLAKGLRVLDLYCYVGGFSASAGLGGAATVVSVDVAPGAIEFAKKTWAANNLDTRRHQPVVADVPKFLEAQEAAGNRFEFIVADPPSFAPNEQSRHGAQRGYTKLHRACLRLLAPGGYMLAASCSSHIDRRDFEDALVEAADKERRNLQILERFGAPPDHPRLLSFPEGDYLKVVIARALD
jgi:23S rRNA (cytosine1962-C5)-methyltransferase